MLKVAKIIDFVNDNYNFNICIDFDDKILIVIFSDDLTSEIQLEIEYGATTEEIIGLIKSKLDELQN